MTDDANVRIEQWIARGGAGNDGFYVKGKGLKGVFSGVGVRGKSVERSQAHGDLEVPVLRSSRFVTIAGPCIADSAEKLDWYSTVLTGLLADGESARVIFELPGKTRWGIAKLNDTPEFEPVKWGERAEWQLSLKFANPRLYGDAQTFPNAQWSLSQIHHFGNFKASPVITVTGSAPSGYTLNLPGGKQFKVTRALVSGSPHVIDMADGYLRIGGVIVSNSVTRADLIAVPGGAAVAISVTPVSGTASLSVLVLDTFM